MTLRAMQDPNPAISRITTEDEFDAVISALIAAFAADPVTRWVLGNDARAYLLDCHRLTRVLARECMQAGTVFRTGDGAGVALWLPPNAPSDEQGVQRVLGEIVPVHLQEDARRLFAWIDRHAPRVPHWYLSLMGVDPLMQGRGVGAALLKDGLRYADADRVPTFLWSSSQRNVSLYKRHGFEMVAEARFGSSPLATVMLRPAYGEAGSVSRSDRIIGSTRADRTAR